MSTGLPNIIYPKEDYVDIITTNSKLKNTLEAWLKFGTVFLIYRFCTYFFFDCDDSDATFFDRESLQLVFFILIGFTIYYILVQPYIPINIQHPILKNIVNDSLMFGTVLVSSHILDAYMTDGDYFNKEWLTTAGMILLAFASYRVLVNPFIPFNKLSPTVVPLISDWTQFGTFLIVFRLLQGKSLADVKWILSVLFVLLGFAGYQLITKKLIKIN